MPPLLYTTLLLLLVAGLVGSIGLNYAHNRRWQAAAEVRGWFYTQPLWRQRRYQVAGMTPGGAIWELNRVQRDGYFYYLWQTTSCPLPFGSLTIMPRANLATAKPKGRLVAVGSTEWQADLATITSHDQLAEWLVVPELELTLRDWPAWPELGSLEKIVWNQHRLEIYGRFHRDWITLDRIVALGEILIESLAAARPT